MPDLARILQRLQHVRIVNHALRQPHVLIKRHVIACQFLFVQPPLHPANADAIFLRQSFQIVIDPFIGLRLRLIKYTRQCPVIAVQSLVHITVGNQRARLPVVTLLHRFSPETSPQHPAAQTVPPSSGHALFGSAPTPAPPLSPTGAAPPKTYPTEYPSSLQYLE